MLRKKIGIIGCGNMGEALVKGLCRIAPKGFLAINDIDKTRRDSILSRYKVRAAKDNNSLVESSEVVILAVKPKDVEKVLTGVRAVLSSDKVLISIAAGVTTEYIGRLIGKGLPVIRVMPNMPAAIGEAISSISAGRFAKRNDMKAARDIFASVGDVVEVKEGLVDAVTAISGSGPAYFFYLIESLLEAALGLGLDEKTAESLIIKTALGSAKILDVLKEAASDLRARVTSKGGTTEAAFKVLESKNFKAIVKEAVKAACKRSEELSKN